MKTGLPSVLDVVSATLPSEVSQDLVQYIRTLQGKLESSDLRVAQLEDSVRSRDSVLQAQMERHRALEATVVHTGRPHPRTPTTPLEHGTVPGLRRSTSTVALSHRSDSFANTLKTNVRVARAKSRWTRQKSELLRSLEALERCNLAQHDEGHESPSGPLNPSPSLYEFQSTNSLNFADARSSASFFGLSSVNQSTAMSSSTFQAAQFQFPKPFSPLSSGFDVDKARNDEKAYRDSLQTRRTVSFESFKNSASIRRQLPASFAAFREPLKLLQPSEETYLTKKLNSSAFQSCLGDVRTGVMQWANSMYQVQDACLTNLWMIFCEQCKPRGSSILENPATDFTKELRALLSKTRVALSDLVKISTRNINAMISMEKDVRKKWADETKSCADVGVHADLPLPEDPVMITLRREIATLSVEGDALRSDVLRLTKSSKVADDLSKRNITFLQSKLMDLHREVFSMLHSMFKHKFRWIDRLPDPAFRYYPPYPMSEEAHEKIQEIVATDLNHLRSFTEASLCSERNGWEGSPPATDTLSFSVSTTSELRCAPGATGPGVRSSSALLRRKQNPTDCSVSAKLNRNLSNRRMSLGLLPQRIQNAQESRAGARSGAMSARHLSRKMSSSTVPKRSSTNRLKKKSSKALKENLTNNESASPLLNEDDGGATMNYMRMDSMNDTMRSLESSKLKSVSFRQNLESLAECTSFSP